MGAFDKNIAEEKAKITKEIQKTWEKNELDIFMTFYTNLRSMLAKDGLKRDGSVDVTIRDNAGMCTFFLKKISAVSRAVVLFLLKENRIVSSIDFHNKTLKINFEREKKLL